MKSKKELIDLLVERALEILDKDDAQPEVGMGMFYSTAVHYAEDSLLKEAARWNALEALAMEFTPEMRRAATDKVSKKRSPWH